jgi:hypothetical protein
VALEQVKSFTSLLCTGLMVELGVQHGKDERGLKIEDWGGDRGQLKLQDRVS